jgi:hypothetical protein
MASSDPIDERRRLAKFYAGMTEGELRKLAEDASSLTETARHTLRSELARRRLAVELNDSVAPGRQTEVRELLTIRQFRDVPEALLAKSILESAGIECFLSDDNLIRIDWLLSNLLGGIKLRVRQEDAVVAARLLEKNTPPEFMVEGVGEYKQPRCPSCESLEVFSAELDDPAAYHWKCRACGREWLEPGDPSA